MISTNKWNARIDFAVLCAWLILGLVLAGIALVNYGVDFRGYYAAVRVLLEGGNPYDYNAVSRMLLQVTGFEGNNPYYYPPWFVWIFIPLAHLPFMLARVVWMAVNYVLWHIALYRLGGALGWSLKGWRLYGLFALTTLSFAWVTWRYEQAGILVMVILTELITSVRAERWTWAGIWLALLLIKPNVTLIIAVGVSLWLIRRRHWHPVVIAILVSIGLLAIATVVTPKWYQPIFAEGFGVGLTSVLDGPDRVVAYRINSTLPDWLATFGVTRGSRIVIYAIAVAAGLGLSLRIIWSTDLFLHAVSTSTLASLALTPYALQYDYPPLVVPFFWGLGLALPYSNKRLISFSIAAFVLSVIFWQQNISWAYWMIVGLVVLLLWGNRQVEPQATTPR